MIDSRKIIETRGKKKQHKTSSRNANSPLIPRLGRDLVTTTVRLAPLLDSRLQTRDCRLQTLGSRVRQPTHAVPAHPTASAALLIYSVKRSTFLLPGP